MSKKYIAMIADTNKKILMSDTAEKDLFLEVYGELKSGDDYDTIVGNIKEACTELVVQKQVITIVNMARDYVGSKLFTRILEMRWYNVKALVALIRYINKEHGAGKVKAIKGRISKVGKDTKTTVEYNNLLAELIAELKQEYKVVITDDSKVVTKNVKAMFNGLTAEQKVELYTLLKAEFDQEVQEMAEEGTKSKKGGK